MLPIDSFRRRIFEKSFVYTAYTYKWWKIYYIIHIFNFIRVSSNFCFRNMVDFGWPQVCKFKMNSIELGCLYRVHDSTEGKLVLFFGFFSFFRIFKLERKTNSEMGTEMLADLIGRGWYGILIPFIPKWMSISNSYLQIESYNIEFLISSLKLNIILIWTRANESFLTCFGLFIKLYSNLYHYAILFDFASHFVHVDLFNFYVVPNSRVCVYVYMYSAEHFWHYI